MLKRVGSITVSNKKTISVYKSSTTLFVFYLIDCCNIKIRISGYIFSVFQNSGHVKIRIFLSTGLFLLANKAYTKKIGTLKTILIGGVILSIAGFYCMAKNEKWKQGVT